MNLLDYEECDVWFQNWPEAKKSHECASCGREIPHGAQYLLVSWLFDHEWGSERQCFGCAWHVQAIIEESDRVDQILRPTPGQLAHWVHELLDWYGEESDEPIVIALRAANKHIKDAKV